ncbi:phosphotransferase enzyme family protein [Histoplasma capsulatum var. duboisii H88]|uniref:Phosphotransferase enzyme family protein n=1 Tax=Ajellomyces capsulatus (strain H88) TaxID=544711 RepID=A0A8A1LHH6_AJEC8|nr:phosphotransferase enzyme family protein [Histoplasma capsulatum var. duboisii H88]
MEMMIQSPSFSLFLIRQRLMVRYHCRNYLSRPLSGGMRCVRGGGGWMHDSVPN